MLDGVEHPYRAEERHSEEALVVLPEPERPPPRVRVRAWSDRTTRMRLRPANHPLARVGFAMLTLVFFVFVLEPGDRDGALILTTLFAVLFARTFRGERISVSPAALSRRGRSGGTEVRALADVSTVVVSGSGAGTRLDLQCGRERLALADGLNYDEATLRWIAQRLRQAIEAAR